MSRTEASKLESVRASAAAALHRLSRELRAGAERDEVLRAVERLLAHVPGLERVFLESGGRSFSSEYVSLPLLGRSGSPGTMHLGAQGGPVGRETLHLAGAVAEFVSLVLGAFADRGERHPGRELLEAAVESLEIGVVVYDRGGVLTLMNAAARRLLGGHPPERWDDLSAASPGNDGEKDRQRSFARRSSDGRLLHVAVRRDGSESPGVAIVRDLSGTTTACRDLVQSEAYRCLVRRERCSLGVLRAPTGSSVVLDGFEQWSDAVARPLRCGLWDPETFVIVAPGAGRGAAERVLRGIARPLDGCSVSLGTAALHTDGDGPDALMDRALQALGPAPVIDRAGLLVFDASQAVIDSVALVFRQSCDVVGCTSPGHALDLLDTRPFDAVVWELADVREERVRAGLCRVVEEPPAPSFFFLAQTAGPWDPERLGLPRGEVFRKPFAVDALKASVQQSWRTRR